MKNVDERGAGLLLYLLYAVVADRAEERALRTPRHIPLCYPDAVA
jgi:hypothetical protein